MRSLFLYVISIMLCFSCSEKKKMSAKVSSFTSFEISYTDGWVKRLTIFVDSSRNYFIPHLDSSYTGKLPAGVFHLLDSAAEKIASDTSIRSHLEKCYDCTVLAMKIIRGKDTIRINQKGHVDMSFLPLIDSMLNFVDSNSHRSISGWPMHYETMLVVSPPPPPILPGTPLPPILPNKKKAK